MIFTLKELADLLVLLQFYKKELVKDLNDCVEINDASDPEIERAIEGIDNALKIVHEDLKYRLQY